MELHEPENLLLGTPGFRQHLMHGRNSSIVEEYDDELHDVEIYTIPPKGTIFGVINSYIKINEVSANLRLLNEIIPSDNPLHDEIDSISFRYEMSVQAMACEIFMPAIEGTEQETRASLEKVYTFLNQAHRILHHEMNHLAKSTEFKAGLAALDQSTRPFVRDALMPRIRTLNTMVAEDF